MYPLKILIARLLLLESKECTFLLALSGLLVGSALILMNNNYTNSFQGSITADIWGIVFIAYGIAKLFQLFLFGKYWLKLLTTCVGLWLWSALFSSIAVLHGGISNISPASILVLIPFICEFFEVLIYIFLCKHKWRSRQND